LLSKVHKVVYSLYTSLKNYFQDHFGLILNEPAGKIAQVVVEHSVNLIVRAWGDNSNPDNVITQVGCNFISLTNFIPYAE
jgi:hypothetical protein